MTTPNDKPMLRVAIDSKSYEPSEEQSAAPNAAPNAAPVVLKDIHFTASEREVVVITGPSGCGKSTLLNLIAGLDKDYQGRIDLPPHAPGALPVAMVFQDPRLLAWRTVRQNLKLVQPPNTDPKERDRLLKQMGIEHTLNQYPMEISMGMSRRVALVRAFLVSAPLLIMDEPFTSIDELTSVRLRELLVSQLEVMARTVVFVTHNIREALFLGHRLVILSSQPASIVANIELPNKPGRSAEEVESLRADILRQFPDILK